MCYSFLFRVKTPAPESDVDLLDLIKSLTAKVPKGIDISFNGLAAAATPALGVGPIFMQDQVEVKARNVYAAHNSLTRFAKEVFSEIRDWHPFHPGDVYVGFIALPGDDWVVCSDQERKTYNHAFEISFSVENSPFEDGYDCLKHEPARVKEALLERVELVFVGEKCHEEAIECFDSYEEIR